MNQNIIKIRQKPQANWRGQARFYIWIELIFSIIFYLMSSMMDTTVGYTAALKQSDQFLTGSKGFVEVVNTSYDFLRLVIPFSTILFIIQLWAMISLMIATDLESGSEAKMIRRINHYSIASHILISAILIAAFGAAYLKFMEGYQISMLLFVGLTSGLIVRLLVFWVVLSFKEECEIILEMKERQSKFAVIKV